jgi:hypothetical protein
MPRKQFTILAVCAAIAFTLSVRLITHIECMPHQPNESVELVTAVFAVK